MKFTDEEILNYCDGNLEKSRVDLIEKTALHDESLALKIEIMNVSALPYEQAFSYEKIPAVPESLTQSVQATLTTGAQPSGLENETTLGTEAPASLLQTRHGNSGRFGLAASLLLGVTLGYLLANLNNSESADFLAQSEQADWVLRVADYQTLYKEVTVSGLDPNEEAATALLNKMEHTHKIKTVVPDLSEHGYTFIRAQELGYKSDPLVQLVYFKPGKVPLAFCYMPSNGEASAEMS